MRCPSCGAENTEKARFCARCGAQLDHAVAAAPSGASVGPYILRGELGRGAMAVVWRAWDTKLDREVALKEPLFDPTLSENVRSEMARRFVREAKMAAGLSHPNIVSIHSADVYDGRAVIDMELVEGTTLGRMLESGPLSPTDALSVLDQLLDAVAHAHEHGVVHRDIKPENIFIDRAGRVKLSDFGVAHSAESGTRATVAGTVLGTPGYMSPEQAMGATVDTRSDLFSVGVVAYEMLVGKNPFGAGDGSEAVTLLYRIVHEPVPELPPSASAGLPADVRPAIMTALSKDPNQRPQTAQDLKAMLHGGAAAGTSRLSSVSAGLANRANKAQGKRPKWLPYAVVGAACVIAIGVALMASGAMGGHGGGLPGGADATAGAATQTAEGMYYLGVSNGKVAVFSNSSAEPVEESDVAASDLGLLYYDAAADVDGHISFDTLDDALAQIEIYEIDIQEAKEAEEEEDEPVSVVPAPEPDNSVVEITVVGAGGDTRTATIHRQGNTERVFPDSNTRRLSDSEVRALSDAERCIAWNEIIAASNGYSFKNSGLAAYFNSCSWYSPVPGASGMGNLTSEASANVDLLKSYTDSWWMKLATN